MELFILGIGIPPNEKFFSLRVKNLNGKIKHLLPWYTFKQLLNIFIRKMFINIPCV